MATLIPAHLSILSACLKSHSFEVELFDSTYYKTEEVSFDQRKVELLQVRPFNLGEKGVDFKQTDIYEDLVKKVSDFKPHLIGITIVEDTYDLALSLLESIKGFNIPVIAGGVFVTFSPDEVIANKAVDMICIGEGEEALVELCQKMSRNEDYSTINNLWVKKDGEIVKNSVRPLININELPYIDFDIFGKERLYRPMFGRIFTMIHIEIDRGCPYDCTYCESPQLSKIFQKKGCGIYYRRKNAERIIAEIKYLVDKYRPDYINFNSEAFLARPVAELEELARLYKEINLPFWAQTRPETVNEEKIKILKSMNCDSLQFGIEHGNEQFRSRMLNRHYSNKNMIEAFKIVEKYNVPYTVNNIIGFPDETRELIFDTIEINHQINPRTINCYIFAPYKGTSLYEYCIKKNYLDNSAKIHHLLDGARLNMNSISYEELKGLQRTFPLYARFPKSEWNKIKIAERFDDVGNRMFEEFSSLYRERYFK